MAYAGNESDEYLPDSDDSDAEDDRPNRWTGPPSTWQQLNGAEIDTLTALNELHNQDLSIHLYNAFALKHRHVRNNIRDSAKPAPNQDVNIVTGQLVQEDKWVPPNLWTAWPLPVNVVPRPEFMKRTDADDEHLTFRMKTRYTPKIELEETISATMLRLAKEKIQARQLIQRDENTVEPRPESTDEESSSIEITSAPSRVRSKSRAKSGSKSRLVKYESTSEGERMDVDDLHVRKRPTSTPPERIRLKTVVATDDELSYTLLRPSAQRILGKLDTTLKVLHNAQESRTHCPSESEASEASSRSQSRSRSRSRGPSGTHTQSPDAKHKRPLNFRAHSIAKDPVAPETSGEVKKRGRPRREYPRLEGETDREYVIRPRCRIQPPNTRTTIPELGPEHGELARKPDDNGESRKLYPISRRLTKRVKNHSDDQECHGSACGTGEMVLGAAALAGFPASALDRAARRCADLFGQDFILHTLQEGPPDQTKSDKRVRYEPGMGIPSLLEDSEDSNDEGPSQHLRASSMTPLESKGRGRGRSAKSQSKLQFRSGSASDGKFYCMVSNCPRAVDPFARRANLVRHLKLIHNYHGDEVPVEVDSEDEIHGAIHVDGFLKPIKVRPGWRGDDAAKEKRKPQQRRKNTRDESVDTRMRDMDSTTSHEVSE
ncbi:hypothetical protein CIB48_g2717 [Xylaria polymorpha]|nr:hypothetical protein CIB48_g2717 [Xylaria polymorpha]